ncbi:short-chain dehydrogenase/reductase SDR [Xylariomycetidae sp. FL0641]|nr:short-chain dehydrogenase/reductase SDR [Xylariomycetidae sp. FL0641]
METTDTAVTGVALIVGAGSGIGLETALTFAERGCAAVVFADQNLKSAQAGAEQSKAIAKAQGYDTLAVHVDVRDRDSVKKMVDAVIAHYARLDYAVNCAGAPRPKESDTYDVDEADYDALHDVNAKGTLHCLQEEIRAMQAQEPRYVAGRGGRRSVGPGSIVTVTSLSAVQGFPKSTTYVASKFAARGIIQCAAAENVRSGLRINEVCPGFTNTPMLRRGLEKHPGLAQMIDRSMPLGRVAAPEEMANVIHFLASPGASFVNGQTIQVDAGVSIMKYN